MASCAARHEYARSDSRHPLCKQTHHHTTYDTASPASKENNYRRKIFCKIMRKLTKSLYSHCVSYVLIHGVVLSITSIKEFQISKNYCDDMLTPIRPSENQHLSQILQLFIYMVINCQLLPDKFFSELCLC